MSRRIRSREVEIFNFSFLDILACTIGLLIFIMVMVFILQSNGRVADSSGLIERKLSEASRADADAARDAQIATALEAALDRVQAPGEPDLKPQRKAARIERDAAQARYEQMKTHLVTAQRSVDNARLALDRSAAQTAERAKVDLAAAQAAHERAASELASALSARKANSVVLSPYRRPGQSDEMFEILHIDCRANNVILLKPEGGKMVEVGRSTAESLDNESSDFQRLIRENRLSDRSLVLFWIRPDGYATYEAAIKQLPAGMQHGFEPADSNWSFESTR